MAKKQKGLSPTIWLLIAIVVALVVALVVMLIVNSGSSSLGRQSNSSITSANDGMNKQTCQSMCDVCKQSALGCSSTRWDNIKGTQCASFVCN